MSNFHPLEVVGRASDTQRQVSEFKKKKYLAFKGLNAFHFFGVVTTW